ncbi:MAG: DUF4838 domain-containing protein [Thermoproteota archaeon]
MVGVKITEKGRTKYHIVISTDAIPSERYAAEELQHYLERISGAKLPVLTDEAPMDVHEIILGDNAHLRRLNVQVEISGLGTDGFLLRTYKDYILIVGGKPRGTLYGVYALLEEKLGIRWFTPEVEFIPTMDCVELPELNEIQVPAFEYREVFWTEMLRNADFAARHRLNEQHYNFTEKHGGPAVVFHPFVHSLDKLIPRELYKEHPEYFPMIDGKRVIDGDQVGYVQRCLSNPDVVKLAIERVRRWIKEHPEATIIDVSQNDTGFWCQCPSCKALDDAEASPAASIIKFVNAIAEAIERDYPNIRIETLAYQYGRKPPKTLRPRHNVIVRLCSIECCFAHPLEAHTCEDNRRFHKDIVTWQPVAPLLYVWDYTTNFAHYLQPFPNFEVLQSNVKFFVKHGVKGLFEQGNYSPGGNGEMAPLRAYVLAKLLWNPDTNIQRHIDEFLYAYYGRAADPIHRYMELFHRHMREKDFHAHIYDPPTSPYLNYEVLEEAERLLDEAERLAESDEIRFRVQVARLPIRYVRLVTKRMTGDSRKELLQRFINVAKKAGITHISEWQELKDWIEKESKQGNKA